MNSLVTSKVITKRVRWDTIARRQDPDKGWSTPWSDPTADAAIDHLSVDWSGNLVIGSDPLFVDAETLAWLLDTSNEFDQSIALLDSYDDSDEITARLRSSAVRPLASILRPSTHVASVKPTLTRRCTLTHAHDFSSCSLQLVTNSVVASVRSASTGKLSSTRRATTKATARLRALPTRLASYPTDSKLAQLATRKAWIALTADEREIIADAHGQPLPWILLSHPLPATGKTSLVDSSALAVSAAGSLESAFVLS